MDKEKLIDTLNDVKHTLNDLQKIVDNLEFQIKEEPLYIEEVRKITCKAKINGEWVEVPFHGIFQYSDVIEPFPMIGGYNGGVIAYPVAVIELENQLIMRSLDTVKDIREVEE